MAKKKTKNKSGAKDQRSKEEGIERYLNREITWLEFNRRVLEQSRDPKVPLLERLRFQSIFRSNLDEFFMKRVGGLQNQVRAKIGPDKGMAPSLVLARIREMVVEQTAELCDTFLNELRPELEQERIDLLQWPDLTNIEKQKASDFFMTNVFPVLTPLAVDTGHPFPFLSNLSASYGVLMRSPDDRKEELFARVKIPPIFPSWIRVNPFGARDFRMLSLYDLVGEHLDRLFPGMEILDSMMFRVTRNANVQLDDDDEDAEDLLEIVEDGLRERKFARVVRLGHGPSSNSKILAVLKDELELSESDIYGLPMNLEYINLDPITDLDRPDLKYPTWVPVTPRPLADREANIFDLVRNSDILVHHPYESFTASVERFIKTASEDPKVIAIKMALYRTGKDSPFIPYLIRAAEAGKQVACVVELQARFDEERNIEVARALEDAGIHVVYGMIGLKTHSKVALVVRNESEGVRSYAHLGTGNYHSKTASLYTDLGLFTAKSDYTDDVVNLFHFLTGRSVRVTFKKLLVAPNDMREPFYRMIDREIHHAKAKRHAHIIAKMNQLEDPAMIDALYRASQAGVKIDLIIRGLCCLRAGVKGLSENIRVISVIGRFLEHSRIFYFANGSPAPEKGEYFIGSADWMTRNLSARVETITPVEEESLRLRLWEILNVHLQDRRLAWEMNGDGTYKRCGRKGLGSQEILMQVELTRNRPLPSGSA